MITSFSIQYMGEMLPKLAKKMAENRYSSADPILKELNVSSLEEAISIFSVELEKYISKNFFPIAAQITFLLAICHKLEGEQEKYVELLMRCLSKNYQKYTPRDLQSLWLEQLNNSENLQLQIEDFTHSPFNVSASFISSEVHPSSAVNIRVALSSCLQGKIDISKVSVTIKSENEAFDVTAFENIAVNDSRKIKAKVDLGNKAPGQYQIEKITLFIGKSLISFVFKDGSTLKVLPYESETMFFVKTSKIPITNFPFSIKLRSENIPPTAEKMTLNLKIAGPACVLPNKENEITTVTEKLEKENEQNFEIFSETKGASKVDIEWIISNESHEIKHTETFDLQFSDSFTPSYKVFGPDRMPFNLKNTPVISCGTEYAFLTTFEYNLAPSCEILSIDTNVQKGFRVSTMQVELPVQISQSEAFTFACFISSQNLKIEDSVIPCSLSLKFRVAGDTNDLTYTCNLPAIRFEKSPVNVELNIPSVSKVDEESEITVDFLVTGDFNDQLILAVKENPFYTVKEKEQNVVIEECKAQLKLHFIPHERGTRAFPLISLQSNDGKIYWSSAPFITSL